MLFFLSVIIPRTDVPKRSTLDHAAFYCRLWRQSQRLCGKVWVFVCLFGSVLPKLQLGLSSNQTRHWAIAGQYSSAVAVLWKPSAASCHLKWNNPHPLRLTCHRRHSPSYSVAGSQSVNQSLFASFLWVRNVDRCCEDQRSKLKKTKTKTRANSSESAFKINAMVTLSYQFISIGGLQSK